MPLCHHSQQLLFTDCRVAGGRKPPQSFQHTQRVGVQRHAGVYPFGSVKDQGGAFAADAVDPPKRFDGGLKVPVPAHKITGPGNQVLCLASTMGNAGQIWDQVINRLIVGAFRCGEYFKKPGECAIDGRVRAMGGQNDSGPGWPRAVWGCQDIQGVRQATVFRVPLKPLESFPHF